jgi:hypothetical protein
VLQAENALGDREAAVEARKAVYELWRASEDPEVRGLSEYVFDQFDVGTAHVYAYETFEPAAGHAAVYTFRVTESGRTVGSVALAPKTPAGARATSYGLDIIRGKRTVATPRAFSGVPDYEALKPMVRDLIAEHFAESSSAAK